MDEKSSPSSIIANLNRQATVMLANVKKHHPANESQRNAKNASVCNGNGQGYSLRDQIDYLKRVKSNLIDQREKLIKQNDQLEKAAELLNKCIKEKRGKTGFSEADLKLLKKCFSPAQIGRLRGKLKTRWSPDDLAVAYTIASLTSQEFCLYLRKEFNFPMPSVSSVNQGYRSLKPRVNNSKNS